MANYYGIGRSNYVRVTDEERFKALCDERNLRVITDKKGLIGCMSDNEDGSFDGWEEDENEDMVQMPDFMDEVAEILKPNEVFVWMSTGNEKMRYLNGYALAINSKGKSVGVNLNDIYKKAKKLGKNITPAEY